MFSMLCPASCLPLLRELAQWRCLLGWHRHHSVGATSATGLGANDGQEQQGSEVKGKGSRPVGHTKPLPSSQVSPFRILHHKRIFVMFVIYYSSLDTLMGMSGVFSPFLAFIFFGFHFLNMDQTLWSRSKALGSCWKLLSAVKARPAKHDESEYFGKTATF